MEVLDAMNWTRWQVRSGAYFCARGLLHDNVKTQKTRHVNVNASLAGSPHMLHVARNDEAGVLTG